MKIRKIIENEFETNQKLQELYKALQNAARQEESTKDMVSKYGEMLEALRKEEKYLKRLLRVKYTGE